MPKAQRLYYSDPFLAEFAGAVTAVRELADSQTDSRWKVSLDRTAFYPTSGGQPFDTGVLRTTLSNGSALAIPVQEVEEDEDGEVWHYLPTEVQPGSQVEGQIDWKRRFDHMQQHTGQHLLSAVFLKELQAPTISFHLGDKVSTIDLAASSLERDKLEQVERVANQIIGEDRLISVRLVSRSDAEALLVTGQIRKLPDREGALRLIDIADCDLNACGGTHVRSTGQIGGLLVRGLQRVSRGLRLEFVCGLRAVSAARADAAALGELTTLLSTGPNDLPAAVGRLLKEGKARAKELQRLREDLAAQHAAALILETPMEGGLRLVMRTWKDRDRDFVKMLASQAAAAGTSTVVIFSAQDAEPARVFVARSRDLDFDCGRMLREELARWGLRGGGSPDLAQGDIPAQQEQELTTSLVESIRRSVKTDRARA